MDGKLLMGADDPQTFEDVMNATPEKPNMLDTIFKLAMWAIVLLAAWVALIVFAVAAYGLYWVSSLVFGWF